MEKKGMGAVCLREEASPHKPVPDETAYQERIEAFADAVLEQRKKNKLLLIVTGSGISRTPSVEKMVEKLLELVEEKRGSESYSMVFQQICQEYTDCTEETRKTAGGKAAAELVAAQSKLLTYIQNAYLTEMKPYVEELDQDRLKDVWESFILWLIMGEEAGGHKGLLEEDPTDAHTAIRSLYREMDAVSITTNFDNLLQKAFEQEPDESGEESFYPLLDTDDFDRYFVSETGGPRGRVLQRTEIQSRGDVFWMRCSGTKNRTCKNIGRQCYVPGSRAVEKDGKIVCRLCGSPAEIYFAFPGTKEKDHEMSRVMGRMWKYLALRCGAVLVVGSSMDYDPVLLNFLQELLTREEIPLLYISRRKPGRPAGEITDNTATKTLFPPWAREERQNRAWVCGEDAADVLNDVLAACLARGKAESTHMTPEEAAREKQKYVTQAVDSVTHKDGNLADVERDLPVQDIPDMIKELKNYSQLGLKTYWLSCDDDRYSRHNRYKHSVGVAMTAAALYYAARGENATREEGTFLQLAAFLHDLGHLPFSHLIEEVFDEFGWAPEGESDTFNHEYNTRVRIRELLETDPECARALQESGYTETDLLRLINGEFGVGYLDAIMNGPVDADKIEYLFSDGAFTGRDYSGMFRAFLNDFCSGLGTTEHGFLTISGNAAKRTLELINLRGQMYHTLYLRRGLRYLEACCKLIIRTFLSYLCADHTLFQPPEEGGDAAARSDAPQVNLSGRKIERAMRWIREALDDPAAKNVKSCEIYLLDKMCGELETRRALSPTMKRTVEFCRRKISETKNEEAVVDIERRYVEAFEVDEKRLDDKDLASLLKRIYLRFPGVLLVDPVKSISTFSFSSVGKRRRRRDETNESVESILIGDIGERRAFKCFGDATEDIIRELSIPRHAYIYVYKITDESYAYMQALDYLKYQLRNQGIISAE